MPVNATAGSYTQNMHNVSEIRPFKSQCIPAPPQTPHPLEWQKYPKLNLEIGSGSGAFAEHFCIENNDQALIAIEKTFSRSKFLLQRNFPNLFSYQSDAVAFATHFISDSSLDQIFILYPNPYLKKKQQNLRWHNRPFMSLLLQKLKLGGKLTLATNIQNYADEAVVRFQKSWLLELESLSKIPKDTRPRTLFEKKYLERNETCWNMVFTKI